MTDGELLKKTAEENRTRMILAVLNECKISNKSLDEAIKEVEKILAGK
ncbi:MAG: protein phosphatase [Lachnospiraceae bacterium]|nr:protein phosphatase [Lachnospiraceae bacterium]